MAKKRGTKTRRAAAGGDLDERLLKLKKIADDLDTCEMGANISVTRLRKGSGNRDSLWVVGSVDKSPKRKR